MVLKVFKKIYSGIGIGCFGFVAMLFIASLIKGGANAYFDGKTGTELLSSATCFIVISVGFYIPSLIYENEKMALWLRTLLHLSIGTIVYMLTAYFAGWLKSGILESILYLVLALGIAAIIWVCIFFYIKAQAKRINKRIKEKQKDE